MKFGVREICDVVLKAKAAQKIGNKIFYAGEPVCYFDTLKTSSMEGAATTVYAQGGRGNARLAAWEGERTVTFTMEDALISPEGFMILSGAGLIDASESKPMYQHVTETVDASDMILTDNVLTVRVSEMPYLPSDKGDNFAYVMLMKNGEIISEPFIPEHTVSTAAVEGVVPVYDYAEDAEGGYIITIKAHSNHSELAGADEQYTVDFANYQYDSCLIDYYTPKMSDAQQIEITADKFGGNYYLEASTLFRDTNGVDMPAEFIIPNCKIQSNFTFTMASSGDPSSFTFTMDAFPDYTRFDKSKKVLAAIQIIKEAASQNLYRKSTVHSADHDELF
jgi:hypothetical protein